MVVCPDTEQAQRFYHDLLFFAQREEEENPFLRADPILYFPAYEERHFREYVPQSDVSAQRIACLYALLTRPGAVLLVTSLPALIAPVIPKGVLSGNVDYLARGEELEREKLLSALTRWGYFPTPLVEEPGDLSLRGGIVDLFPPLYARPIRIEFFGDLVESLREFNPATQRSVRDLEELYLLPISEIIWDPGRISQARERLAQAGLEDCLEEKEKAWLNHRLDQGDPFEGAERWLAWFYDQPGSLKDYLPPEILLIWNDPLNLQQAFPTPDPEKSRVFFETYQGIDQVSLEDLPLESADWPLGERRTVPAANNREISRLLHDQVSSKDAVKQLGELLTSWQDLGQEVWLVVSQDPQARRLQEILSFYRIEAAYHPEHRHLFGSQRASLQIMTGRLSQGFRLADPPLIFLTEEEIFNPKKESRKKARRDNVEAYITSLDDLKIGELVVHREHGIGRYQGLRLLRLNGWEGEFLFLEYAEGDKLYLPVDRIQGIHKFVGLEGQVPPLDRLGGTTWNKAKARVKKAVEKIARELVDLYARRALAKGFAFSQRDQMFKEFEAAFAYEETPDQLRTIEEVLSDMESEKPMDRLVCGDVGYGKTEVALRAAFRAVLDGKQTAFLVPTTVLAEQHYQTMRQRFEGYPVEVRILSRFKSPKEQKKTLEELAAGRADIVIGTHRLLQKDVHFRDLGLMVIDEEHRFGVTHKERLKTLRTQVDCLTLTATPIPRTLQLSLTSIRDLSTIETPPENRQSIRTIISRFDEDKIKEAVQKEQQRGGQVFFVHNRVHNIQAMAHYLRKILPGIRIGVAHGQLPERELEKVMLQFVNRELDLLLCTTIIESGLDIPTANTIIINQADRFGLAQMYQLRGRVGRSRERAYAYLMISGESSLTRDAQKRLKVLMDYSELGSGFKIALHDLQIRGSGNLLGTSQSGHIAAVGYEMYLQMLEEAIQEFQGEAPIEDWEPEIRIQAPAYIPEGYVADPGHRLSIYKRLASLKSAEELESMEGELSDRFGKMPPELKNLLAVLFTKQKMKRLGLEKLEVLGKEVVLSFYPKGAWDPIKLVALIQKNPKTHRFIGEGKLSISGPGEIRELGAVQPLLDRLGILLN